MSNTTAASFFSEILPSCVLDLSPMGVAARALVSVSGSCNEKLRPRVLAADQEPRFEAKSSRREPNLTLYCPIEQ